ncbi:1-phosphofructokinase family hexose kinase [Lactobacillus sp. ESL0228]|uniref:1-phosphofructokinase family hexose kinase n=1 Tax=Lactobacillus sp. ESL0228 TaxID=2069352 RepID=UPI000EFD627D|nr:1-phosphofructokinase family hexose kinase [Lactobacillus sp. ESL0228]RMC47344.1 1-phosphofructokinase family hexose kinase [Lactobacillus sp. ESL0228]
MDITVTINPSVDRLYRLDELKVGGLNRVHLIKKMVGGKGINAARVSACLGAPTFATGFLAGSNGKYILDQAKNDHYTCDFIKAIGNTRNCYTIISKDGKKTEINEHGDCLVQSYFDELLEKLTSLIKNNDVNAISLNGSLPVSEVENVYSRIIVKIRELNPQIKIVLDTSGQALREVLTSNNLPDVIKPNEHEAAEILSIPVTYDSHLLKREIEVSDLSRVDNIIISLGAKGALVKQQNDFYKVSFRPVSVVNTEGSGDSVVGGLLYALDQKYDFKDAICLAIAAGTANAMEIKTGFVQPERVFEIMKTIEITPIND